MAGFLACVLGMRLALRWGWVDRPDQVRKWHARPVPVVGGVAVFSAFFSAFLWDPFVLHSAGFFLLSTLGFLCLGFVDDVCLLSPRMRLGAQLFFVLLALVPFCVCVTWGFCGGMRCPLAFLSMQRGPLPCSVF